MNTTYLRLAYERTVITSLRRHLEEKYLEGGGGLKEELICEAVPYEVRQVPNETFIDVIQRLHEDEKNLTDEMAQYEFRKRDARPLPQKPSEEEQEAPADVPADEPKPRGKGGKPRAEPRKAG